MAKRTGELSYPLVPFNAMNKIPPVRNVLGLSSARIDADFLASYRILLLGQYHSLPQPPTPDNAHEEAAAIAAKVERENVAWEDLYRLELAIIRIEPAEQLKRRAWILRNEYCELASPKEFEDYKASDFPDPKDPNVSIDLLRADLVHLQEEINWRYSSLWAFEEYRSNLAVGATVSALLVSGAVSLLMLWLAPKFGLESPLINAIFIAGVLGGLTTTLRRVQNTRLTGNTDLEMTGLDNGNMGVFLSPALGGLFAWLLFLMFAGNLLGGSLFPKVSLGDIGVGRCHEVCSCPALASLLVWSFVAGFAEQLVPDRLSKLASEAEKSDVAPK